MTEKKGFFRRVFSFGQPDETAIPQETSAPTPAPGAAAPEGARREWDGDAAGRPSTHADALTETPVAIEPEPLPEPAASVAADEPVWLAPEAPEPEADFSWLDADTPDTVSTPAHEPDAEAPVADDGRTDPATTIDETQAIPTNAIAAPGTIHPSDGDTLSSVSPNHLPSASPEPDSVEEDDFSFLDADAPLPDEEEDDFSWLAPEAPLSEPSADEAHSPSGAIAATGAAGIAAAGISASPSTGEGGWRLRETAARVQAPAAPRPTFIDRLREGLSRSSNQLSGSITALFTKRRLDDDTLQEFEDVLLQADLGVETALRITDRLSEGRFGKEITGDQVKTILADEVEATLRPVALPLELDLEKKPHVILVVGVNGTGKTTTIGKLAAKLTRGGLKVTLCAGDTFRAAAVEQLKIWGTRTGSEVVAKAIGADAAGLAYEAYDRAVENGSDVLIIDTAGRLQNKTELMAELEKIVRVLQKREPDAPHTVLQTLDATTGQNALSQVEIFRNVAGVNGLVMTKLDGTARGGILVAIAAKYRLPVYFVGVGEGIDDLEPFKARDFANAIAGKV